MSKKSKKRKAEHSHQEDCVNCVAYERAGFETYPLHGYNPPAPFVATSETSIEAAEQIKPHAESLRTKVLKAIERYGPITDEEITYYTGIDPSTARPRRVELARQELIEKAGVGTTSAGRNATTWKVVA